MRNRKPLLDRIDSYCDSIEVNRPKEIGRRFVYVTFLTTTVITCGTVTAAIYAWPLVALVALNPVVAVTIAPCAAGCLWANKRFHEFGRSHLEFDRIDRLIQGSFAPPVNSGPDVRALLAELHRRTGIFEKQEIREMLVKLVEDDPQMAEWLRENGDLRLSWMLDNKRI